MTMKIIFSSFLVLSTLQALRGQESAPISISISPQRASVRAGAEVILDVIVTNMSDRLLTLAAVSPELVYELDVKAPDGTAAVPTEAGLKKTKDAHIWRDNKTFPEVALLPRQTFHEVIRINDKVEMWANGVYSVRLHRKIPAELGHGEVESNTVAISVTYNPAVEKYEPQRRKQP